ncbi:unnamed protein product [Mesocestoides corti]|uniref:Uncharacterized protein n=1 Tax=Mesocestoides corti TaxID=53468 RepID=A0A0R3UAK3_MESCO|nr:unnamed protein product [Mesocestoides corti]
MTQSRIEVHNADGSRGVWCAARAVVSDSAGPLRTLDGSSRGLWKVRRVGPSPRYAAPFLLCGAFWLVGKLVAFSSSSSRVDDKLVLATSV